MMASKNFSLVLTLYKSKASFRRQCLGMWEGLDWGKEGRCCPEIEEACLLHPAAFCMAAGGSRGGVCRLTAQ